MKLPSSTVRAALKLQSPAQRLYWSLTQLFGALPVSPAIAANVAAGIPASTANAGISAALKLLAPGLVNDIGYIEEFRKAYKFFLILPVDVSQVNRGVSMLKSIRELTVDAVETPLWTIPSTGNSIDDNSTATTIEQYIYEQFMLTSDDWANNPVTISDYGDNFNPDGFVIQQQINGHAASYFNNSNKTYNLLPNIVLTGHILKDPTSSAFNDVVTQVSPFNVRSFAGYPA